MTEFPSDQGKKSAFSQHHAPRPAPPPRQRSVNTRISCRATNPLSLHDNLEKVFLDEKQARATTTTRLFRNTELANATRLLARDFIANKRSGKLSMWSAGCSSGEEVYSMGMIALNEFRKAQKQPQLELYGTDINPQRIAEARAGRYGRPGEHAFTASYWQLLATYAAMDNTQVQIGQLLQSLCRFLLFDMRKKPKKHTFNFIVCNHVLQYYDLPGQKHIINNLIAVLKPGGRLYLEGVTDHCLVGLNLRKIPGLPHVYAVPEKTWGG